MNRTEELERNVRIASLILRDMIEELEHEKQKASKNEPESKADCGRRIVEILGGEEWMI